MSAASGSAPRGEEGARTSIEDFLDNVVLMAQALKEMGELDEPVEFKRDMKAARLELASLRARLGDLELMLRGIVRQEKHVTLYEPDDTRPGKWKILVWERSNQPTVFYVPDDGTGLPKLDAAARAALEQT